MQLSLLVYILSIALIPQPASLVEKDGYMGSDNVTVYVDKAFDNVALDAVKSFFEAVPGNRKISVVSPRKTYKNGFAFICDPSLKDEEYNIDISLNRGLVTASGRAGIINSVQTLKQLAVVNLFPCCEIHDYPRFAYRGVMLDCGRHFFEVDEIKKILDVMALYKMNRFHWHLTEDQGWRIEIKKYPKLTETGAWRSETMVGRDYSFFDGKPYGGFYTQDQLRDVVAYAEKLGITIVPEIDLPGHMMAALASYPEFGCEGSEPAIEVWRKWGISKQVLNAGKESAMRFLEDVLTEVCEIFPSEYIHIGGDECPKDEWERDPDCQRKIKELGLVSDEKGTAENKLQGYVIARLQKHISKYGRKLAGWEDIMAGDIQLGTMVYGWRGTAGGARAAESGHDVVMCPWTFCYLDYSQDYDVTREPLAISTTPRLVVSLDRIYSYEPYKVIAECGRPNVKGVQANLWSELIYTNQHLEYMLLPRIIALSEVQWCQPENKNFDSFKRKLQIRHLPRLREMGYEYRESSSTERTLKEEWMSYLNPPDYYNFEHETSFAGKRSYKDFDIEILFQANGPGTTQRVIKVFPKNVTGPCPTVVTPYYFPEGMLGFELDDSSTPLPEYEEINFMVQLARRGIASISAESFHLTSIRSDKDREDFSRWKDAADTMEVRYPSWCGIGKLFFDTELLVDLVEEDPRMDSNRIGIAGHSLGGKMAYYAGMLDDRIKVVMASDFGLLWDDSNWNAAWYWGDMRLRSFRARGFENLQLIRISCEKPLCIIGGRDDNKNTWNQIRFYRFYEAQPDHFLFINHASGHRPPQDAQDQAFDFVEKWLNKE